MNLFSMKKDGPKTRRCNNNCRDHSGRPTGDRVIICPQPGEDNSRFGKVKDRFPTLPWWGVVKSRRDAAKSRTAVSCHFRVG